jgi:cell pole-organizing protein PopZ
MEDILASIRRILSEDEAAVVGAGQSPVEQPSSNPGEGVLVLDNSMMIGAPPAPEPEMPVASEPFAEGEALSRPGIMASESEAAAAASVGTLLRTLTAERTTETHHGGPTIEDLVREGIRPLLKSWLDVHLPPLVERVVRAEIDRITRRASL